MKSFFNIKSFSASCTHRATKHEYKNRASYWLVSLLGLFLFFGTQNKTHAQACASTTPSVLAKWTFQEFTANAQCNGAIQRSGPASRIYPTLKSDAYVYCPDINSGCGQALLGSTGHANTVDFANALCLMNFYYVESLIGGKFCTGIPCNGYDPNSTVWNPAIPANIYTTYIIPQGKYGCLSSFSLKISTPNSTTPTFAKQGVAVYRNGVQIYSQTQNITKPHEVMTFTFPSTAMFCSDGSKEVTYKVVFGLVERLTDFKAGRITGYDDITINGTCGSNPSPIAAVSPATCSATGANSDGKITLASFGATDKYAYTTGSTYTGSATYASGSTTIPANGIIASTLANPATPQTYTVRVFTATCYTDKTVTLNPVVCPSPNPDACTKPTGTVLTATQATCNVSNVANTDAKVAVTAVTGGDKVGISAGSSYEGASYANATALVSGAYTFTGLPNPLGSQVYTVRVFNGGDDCFTDQTVTLTQKLCGACETACGTAWSATSTDAVSSNNTACFTACTGTQNIDLKLTAGVSPTAGSTCGSTGTDFVWTFTLQNTGTMAATNIQVADLMPNGLLFGSSNPSTGSHSQSSGWLVPSLAAGASATLTVTTKALVAGTYKYTAEVMSASPLNDPNSTPANGVTTEDDYSSATITVTGNSSPTISKEFSPMQTKANMPTRLTIKITNNESTPVNLTADFIDTFPTSPAAMVVATTPNLSSNLTGVIATAGGTSIKIPSGTVLLPGLNQISVDVTVPSDGTYCNDIAVGSLKTTVGNNCVIANACVIADGTYQIPPSIKKSFSVSSVNTNTNATLTITIQNQDPLNFILSEKFVDYLPTGLILGGATSGTCPNISTFGSTDQVGLTAGAVIPTGSCTIVVPVKSATAGTYCNRIGLNQLTGTIGTYENIGNQDIAEACLTVVAAPCTAIDLTSITQSPIGNIAPNTTVNLTALGTGIDATKTAFNWSTNSIGGGFNPQSNTASWTAPAMVGSYTIKLDADNQITGYGSCKESITLKVEVQTPCGVPNCGAIAVIKN